MKKSMLIPLLACSILLTGCLPLKTALKANKTEETTTETTTKAAKEATEDDGSSVKTKKSQKAEEKKNLKKVKLEKQEIYNQDDIIVTVTGMDITEDKSAEISFTVENNSGNSISVSSANSSINGYMVDCYLNIDVAAGKKANDKMEFYKDDLTASHIETIGEIEFKLDIRDSASYDNIAMSDPIILKTSAADSYTQKSDDSGNVIYEEDGIKIVSKNIVSKDSYYASELELYIENSSESDIHVSCEDTSVNGYMIDPSFYPTIAAGKKIITYMSFTSDDLKDNDISDIEEIETTFTIRDTESYSNIGATDPVTISFK